ncbi:MAG: hypothetical protein V7744_19930 [Pseudomonadales bacterium]
MKIHIMDPGLITAGGHNQDWCVLMAVALQKQGHEVTLYCSGRAPDSLVTELRTSVPTQRVFRFNPYVNAKDIDPICGDIERQILGAETVVEDLRKVSPADLWMWPTMFAHEMMAIARLNPKVALSAVIHHRPTEDGAWWRLAGKYLSRSAVNVKCIGTTNDEVLTHIYPLLSQFNPQSLPMPVDGNPTQRESLKTIGILSNFRHETGAKIIVPLLQYCLDQGYKVLISDARQLPESIAKHPNLTELGFIESFATAVEQCDLVLVPYLWHRYMARTSGLVNQAQASAVPCIVPAGAGFSRQLRQLGCAELFHQFDINALQQAIQNASNNYQSLAKSAYDVSQQWKKRHGLQRFLYMMEHGPAQ